MENNNGNTYSDPDLSQYGEIIEQYRDAVLEQYGASQPSANGFNPQLDIQELNYVPGLNQPQPWRLTVRPDEIMYSQGDMQPQTLTIEDELQEVLGERLNSRHHRIVESGSNVTNPLVMFDGLLWSIELHRRLAAAGLIQPLTPRYVQQRRNEMVIVEVDHWNGNGSRMPIPFFPGLLMREPHTKCAVCDTDTEFSLDQEGLDEATQGFGKQWISGLLNFPLWCELRKCEHALLICRACIRRHIETQVAELGRWAPDRINCPWPRCRHRLTREDIAHFASADVYHRYEDHCTRKMLSRSPDFRWCLRPGCGRGGFYENAGLPLRSASELPYHPCPRGCITCPHCAMAMCYFCQVPWHRGLTCQQFQAQRAEREELQATVEWERKYTRICPGEGCGVRVYVDGGCCAQAHCDECATDFCFGCCMIRGSGHAPGCRIQRILDRKRRQRNRRQTQTRGVVSSRRANVEVLAMEQYIEEMLTLRRNIQDTG